MKRYDPRRDGPLEPLVPHGLADMALAVVGLLILLVGLCALAPGWFQDPPLPAQGPPLVGSAGPAWYWLPLLGLAGLLPGAWGFLPGLAVLLALAGLPFWDHGPRLPLRQRPHFVRVMLLALLLLGALTLWGAWRVAS
jgi:quinol-cytochrome oxidoreductase complex cytochrome b subunit